MYQERKVLLEVMSNNKKSRKPAHPKSHNSPLRIPQNNANPRYIPLEKLVADSWAASIKRGIYSYRLKEEFGTSPPVNIIKIEDLDVGLIGIIKDKKSDEKKPKNTQTRDVQDPFWDNAVLIATRGPPFKCAVADERMKTHLLSENLIALSLDKRIPAAYVSAYLNSAQGQREFDKYTAGSSQFARIYENYLKLFEICIPPEDIREYVYSWFEHACSYERTLNQERALLSQLSTGIFQALGGEPSG